MKEGFRTVLQEAQAEIVEKKSRFIAVAAPIKTEEEARAFIEKIRKKHYNATHNVFAYQVGDTDEIQRYSDDGEPKGTAGMPILNLLKGEEVHNTVIVVTRYFGGILLGTGGLVRAYGKAAKEGLEKAQIVTLHKYGQYTVLCNYTDSGKIQYEFTQKGYTIIHTEYTENVTFLVLVEKNQTKAFQDAVTELTNARAQITEMEDVFAAETNG